MVRKTKEEAEATRERILNAAETVFLAKGVSATTLEHIAREAGLTRGAIYWHFKDKADLLEAMLERVRLPMNELADERRKEPGYTPLSLMRELCGLCLGRLKHDARYRNIHAIICTRCEFVPGGSSNLERLNRVDDDVFELVMADFTEAESRGELRQGVTPRTAAIGLFAVMHGLFHCWLREPDLFDPDVEGAAVLDTFFTGIAQPANG